MIPFEHRSETAQRAPHQVARARRHRSAGQSFTECLLMIALTLGGCAWACRTYVHSDRIAVWHRVDNNHNREAELTYSHKLRETHFNKMHIIRNDLAAFFDETIKKVKYAHDQDAFEQRYTELVAELRDHVEEFDQLTAPKVINAAHTKISHSHKTFYEALILLRKGFYEQDKDEQKADYAQATKTFGVGWWEDLSGEQQAHDVLDAGLI